MSAIFGCQKVLTLARPASDQICQRWDEIYILSNNAKNPLCQIRLMLLSMTCCEKQVLFPLMIVQGENYSVCFMIMSLFFCFTSFFTSLGILLISFSGLTKCCMSISYSFHLLVRKGNIWDFSCTFVATQSDWMQFTSKTMACECTIKQSSLCHHLALHAKSSFKQCVYNTTT